MHAPLSLDIHVYRLRNVLILCTIILIIRLAYIQVWQASTFTQASQRNYTRIQHIAPLRGNIFDRHGTLLATNRLVTNIYWRGDGTKELNTSQKELISKLCTILSLDNTTVSTTIARAERSKRDVLIKADVSYEELAQVAEWFGSEPSIITTTHYIRDYPQGSLACHIIGTLNRENRRHGTSGLERYCDELLHGKEGISRHIINSFGKSLQVESIIAQTPGAHIQTTIDAQLQSILERIYPGQRPGACILFDPDNGDILAMLSRPSYSPAMFLGMITFDEWHTLQQQQPFINRACEALYPPGSFFKLVTIAAALEQGFITPETQTTCTGYVSFGNRDYWCSNKKGHGTLTVPQSIAHSCNYLFFELGQKIPVNTLAEYAHRFGLGKPTGILLNEKTGLVPNTEWKLRERGETWQPGETLSVTIGQSFLLATPLQIARLIGSVCTGYLVRPRIILAEPIDRDPLMIEQATQILQKKGMKWVVKKGTARGLSTIKDVEIYAKTSTAQTSTKTKRHLGKQYLEHGWFAAYFKYGEQKPLVLVVIVEHTGSSQIPKTIARQFLQEYRRLIPRNTNH